MQLTWEEKLAGEKRKTEESRAVDFQLWDVLVGALPFEGSSIGNESCGQASWVSGVTFKGCPHKGFSGSSWVSKILQIQRLELLVFVMLLKLQSLRISVQFA